MNKDKLLTNTLYTLVIIGALALVNPFAPGKTKEEPAIKTDKQQTVEFSTKRKKTTSSHLTTKRNTSSKIQSKASSTENLGDYNIHITQIQKTDGGYKKTVGIDGFGEYSFETKLDDEGNQKLTKCVYTSNDGKTVECGDRFADNFTFSDSLNTQTSNLLFGIDARGQVSFHLRETGRDYYKSVNLDGSQSTEEINYPDADPNKGYFYNHESQRKFSVAETMDKDGNIIEKTERIQDFDNNGNHFEEVRKMDSHGNMYLAESDYVAKNNQRAHVLLDENGQYTEGKVKRDDRTTDFYKYQNGQEATWMRQTKETNGNIRKDYYNYVDGEPVADHYEITTPASTLITPDGKVQLVPKETYKFYPDGTPYEENKANGNTVALNDEYFNGEMITPVTPRKPTPPTGRGDR